MAFATTCFTSAHTLASVASPLTTKWTFCGVKRSRQVLAFDSRMYVCTSSEKKRQKKKNKNSKKAREKCTQRRRKRVATALLWKLALASMLLTCALNLIFEG